MAKVLWLSRHDMDAEALANLKDVFASEEIEVTKVSETVSGWQDVVRFADEAQADIIAAVLPISILADLVNPRNNDKPVIRCIMKREPTNLTRINPITGVEEPEFRFVFDHWEVVERISIETSPLESLLNK